MSDRRPSACPNGAAAGRGRRGPDLALLAALLAGPSGRGAVLPVGLAGLRIRRLLVDRTGQVVAADPRTRPLGRLGPPPDPRRPCPPSASTGALPGNVLARLLTDLPAPPPRTDAYRPTAAQSRVGTARDPRCCFPGCGRRTAGCELDHRRPHPDGPTSTADLHPLCGHHHRLEHDGWHSRRHPDGTTTWTSPRGQTRTTSPPCLTARAPGDRWSARAAGTVTPTSSCPCRGRPFPRRSR